MKLVAATHPETTGASDFNGNISASARNVPARVSLDNGRKVRALMAGRYNVSYDDINSLAYPIMRHRIKPSFEAITSGLTTDQLITELVSEMNGKKSVPAPDNNGNGGNGGDKKRKRK